MPSRNTTPLHFRKTLLALAAGAMLVPHGAWAIDLAQSPPGTVEPYVRPNVIISIDDSGSMDYCLTLQKNGSEGTSNCAIAWDASGNPTTYANVTDQNTPNADGTWPANARRINVLKYSLSSIFDPSHPKYDPNLLPDKKIRIAWQAMWNNGNASNAKSVDSATMNTNSMRVLEGSQRTNFISFVNSLDAANGTPSHLMFSQADAYMRRALSKNGPWSSNPGGSDAKSTEYLACRRNYHIMMTDGRWNGTATDVTDTGRRDNATNISLPDGTVYGGSTAADLAKTALYRDTYTKTLSDWAFFSWAKPLQTVGLTGIMEPAADYRKAPATENFGKDSANKDAILDRYWNPRYNPATWAHMSTYTIGFSSLATTWPGAPTIEGPTAKVPFGYDKSFPDLVTGKKTWPDMSTGENVRSLDLWHAALNGRGRFYGVTKGEDLAKAFADIFQQINTVTDPDLTSTATSGSNSTRNDVGKFTGAYEPKNAWKGFVTAETVKTDGDTIPSPGWGGKNTADKLDALSATELTNRLVLSWSDKWLGTAYQGGVPFQWASNEANLSTPQKLWLQKNIGATTVVDEGAAKGEQRLNYIRGNRSLEGSELSGYSTAKPYRERQSRQGDIINSVVWYTGAPSGNYALNGYSAYLRCNKSRPAMIYVGGNDGMFHGFLAANGAEKIAYVPQGVIPSLSRLTDPLYNNKHRFFVDGSAMTGDIDTSSSNIDPLDPCNTNDWRTMLVGTLGAGGKGYFVLDVTNPTATAIPGGAPAFDATKASQLVKLDRTRSIETGTTPDCTLASMSTAERTACNTAVAEDKDIGHITAQPVQAETDPMRTTQITRMNNNRWAAVMGNGYNSTNQRPVLLVQYLDGARELLRIPVTTEAAGTGKAIDNGLSAPRLVDINGDGTPDVAYAGDNQGNMWKFDLTNGNASNWRVAFGGAPLFTAKGPASLNSTSRAKVQPITAAPTVSANDRTMTVGTGPTSKDVSVGGMMVAFGTGRNVDKTDASNVDVQSLYSVLDNTRYRTASSPVGTKLLEVHPGVVGCTKGADCVPVPRALGEGVTNAELAQQKITELSGGNFATVDVVDELKLSTWKNYNGWYLDLPSVGERLLKPMEFYDGSNILAVYSQVPAKGSNVDPNIESCESVAVDSERQYRTLINIMDGKRPTVQIVDMDGNGIYNSITDQGVSRATVSKGSHNLITKGNRIIDIDTKNLKTALARMPEQSVRPSWRQVK